jgi:N-acetyl-anhydromuramyl-L-alanine amidase AmpD
VERDGTILEVFPPEEWAHHLKVGDLAMERRSIGIELASEGPLTVQQEGGRDVLWAQVTSPGKRLGFADELLAAGRVIRFPNGYRGYTWFDQYDRPQIAVTIRLVTWLCEEFFIPKRVPLSSYQPDGDAKRWTLFQGVLHHAMVRPDKSDLHPGFPFGELALALGDPAWKTVSPRSPQADNRG